jgi:hypothetical protein
MPEREALVIEAQAIEDCGREIMDVNFAREVNHLVSGEAILRRRLGPRAARTLPVLTRGPGEF